MIAARQIYLGRGGGANLPYDAEVEYLESTGTQVIDTGVYLKYSDMVEIDYSFSNRGSALGIYDTTTGDTFVFNLTGSGSRTIGRCVGGWSADTSLDIKYSVRLGDGRFYIDDVLIGSTEYTDKQSSHRSCPLFCRTYRINTYTDYLKGRIYSCRIIRDGNSIRDFIPVRFTNELGQSEGAMYDRVSGQLFRNQGTGAFAYGGDVYSVPVETSQYVQDGLVAMWDGIENAGVGKHSPNTTVWKDLVGGADSTFSVSPEWGVNCLKVLAVDNVITFNSTNAVSAIGSDKFAIEIVARMDSLTGNRLTYICDAISYATLQIFTHNSSALYIMRQFGSMSSVSAYGSDVIPASGSCSTVYDESLSTYNTLFYKNGAYSTRRNNTTRISLSSLYSYMRSGGPSGSYYNLRIYNRAPTAAEISANYAVDKARFNLP